VAIIDQYRYRVSLHAPAVSHSTDEDDQEGRIHFQQDDAPLHYFGDLWDYLNTEFGRLVEWRR
jgi:hypothetical protein